MLTLIKPYLNRGHRLFVDNYYTTPKLVQYLLDKGTKLVGTVRPNKRNFPHDLATANVNRGESKFSLLFTGVLAVKYKQPKVVHLLTPKQGRQVSQEGQGGQ